MVEVYENKSLERHVNIYVYQQCSIHVSITKTN